MIPFPFNYDDMNFPTLRFVFDRKKIATKTRRGLIQIEVLFKGRRKWIGTGVKVYSDQWDDRKMIINCLESIELNERLSNQRKSIEEWVAELARVNGQFSFDGLERFLNAGQERGEDYISFVERRIEERKDIRESTKKSQRKFPRALKAFGAIRYFSDLTVHNIQSFDNWLHGKDYTQTTVHSYHKFNKIYINDAIRSGLLDKNPYDSVKIERGKSRTRKYLTPDELSRVEGADIPLPTIDKVRDLFLFQCYTGFAYAELAGFDFKDVIRKGGKYVIYDRRQKSDEEYYIVLLSPAVRILEKYGFVLPVISNQQYNMRLKIVADYAGLDKHLTSHMGRHTFAVMCLIKGAKIENVAKMMGHADISTTQMYAKVLNSEVEREFDMIEQSLQKEK